MEASGLLATCQPWFATTGKVDLLLGTDFFSRVVLHGWRVGPSSSLSALKTQYGWVLAADVRISHASQGSTNQCYILTIAEDNQEWMTHWKNLGRISLPLLRKAHLSGRNLQIELL